VELGHRLNGLIQPGGFKEDKDKALIQQMSSVMTGLFGYAYDPENDKAGVWDTTVDGYGAGLARSLVDDSLLNQVSIREQVFRATLMQVVTEVFWTKGSTLTTTEQAAVEATVKELAKTYAWLNPQEEASVPADQADYGFLDRLWQLQVPHLVLKPGGKRVSEFKSAGVIAAELQKAVEALGRLLTGVNEPIKALQFLNGLIQAETYVTSLKSNVKNAPFLRETVELGVTYASKNLAVGSTAPGFLNQIWRGGTSQVTQARQGLYAFFSGVSTPAERINGLDSVGNLLKEPQDEISSSFEIALNSAEQQAISKFLNSAIQVGVNNNYVKLGYYGTARNDLRSYFANPLHLPITPGTTPSGSYETVRFSDSSTATARSYSNATFPTLQITYSRQTATPKVRYIGP
jgi:hypothetical protein